MCLEHPSPLLLPLEVGTGVPSAQLPTECSGKVGCCRSAITEDWPSVHVSTALVQVAKEEKEPEVTLEALVSLSGIIGSNGPHPSLDLVDSTLGPHAGTLAMTGQSQERCMEMGWQINHHGPS